MDKTKSIRFPEDLEKKIRILAAEEGISFGEWVRKACVCVGDMVFKEQKKEAK